MQGGPLEHLVHRVAGAVHGQADEIEARAGQAATAARFASSWPVPNSSAVNTASGTPRRTARSCTALRVALSPSKTGTGWRNIGR